tara:strand:- start:37 stop:213 length:177 start_codon:yes stop_codon:yes gene_type:complete
VDYKDKLRNKKLKAKLEYLRLELEDTQMTFHDSLVLFQNDFTEYIDEWDNPKNVKKVI